MASNLSLRDNVRLAGVHPTLIAGLDQIYGEMAALGHRMFTVQGLRTTAMQQGEYAKGRTISGPNVTPQRPLGDVVTMKDGVRFKSNHQAHENGYGFAVDSAFAGVADPFAISLPWQLFGEKVERLGFIWGGRWSHPHDSPHAELSK